MNKQPKPQHIEWAKYLRKLLPGEISVTNFYDETKENSIAIFKSKNKEGIVTSTIGVMDTDISSETNTPLFTEVLLDVRGHNEVIENILATIAFFIIKNKWKPSPGVVFENMLEMYNSNLKVNHVLFVPPFQWEEGMSKVVLTQKTIYPLLAVPITTEENQFISKNGYQELENIWIQNNIDVLNWDRENMV